jgi:CheY-like chemotaxis protein
VDDDEDIRTLLHEVLHDSGYAVASACDGTAALEILTTHEPAAILVDLRMPTMDGWSFIEQYRRRGGRARIVLFTALGEFVKGELIPGVDALVRKPFDLDVLLSTVAEVLQPPMAARPTVAREA